MDFLKNIIELTEMLRISISDSETCEADIDNLENDFQQRELRNIDYDKLSDRNKKSLDNIKNDMLLLRKRTYIKTMFSNIEGILYATKQKILENKDKIENDNDIIDLQEKRYEGSTKDRLTELIVYPSFFRNIKLVFKYFKGFHSSNFDLNKFYTKLDTYRIVKEIRNKLTHPKQTKDLFVTEDEFEICKEFESWFYSEFRKLLENES